MSFERQIEGSETNTLLFDLTASLDAIQRCGYRSAVCRVSVNYFNAIAKAATPR
jgi:hypothetical protein